MELDDYLSLLVRRNGSDLYLTSGAPACAKFDGRLTPLSKHIFTAPELKKIALSLMTEQQQAVFRTDLEMNLGHSIPKIGRFRINIFKQQNQYSIVARNIHNRIPLPQELGLPETLKDTILEQRGLILFVGATGSGKSTSLASLIDHRNNNMGGHIVTIEDPIEYVHKHRKSLINQREVGVDTRSFQSALKNAMRQAPDVIMIGEIRDQETMEQCLTYSETGHLVIATLHANNANQAIARIINFFATNRHQQILHDLALNLRAIVSQRLITGIDNRRCAAFEVLLGTPTTRESIMRGDIKGLKEVMAKGGENTGMQTFDDSLFNLYQADKISQEQAIIHADSANDMRLRMNLDTVDDGIRPVAEPHSSDALYDGPELEDPLQELQLLEMEE